MAKFNPGHLKLHVGESPESAQAQATGPTTFDLDQLFSAFAQATGWRVCTGVTKHSAGSTGHSHTKSDGTPLPPLSSRMRLVPDSPIDGALDIIDENVSVVSEETAWTLLQQIDCLVQSLAQAERTIELQEVQLASSVGVSIRSDEADVLAAKLQESLHRAATLTVSDAAAIYLLDEGTSQLKMRSCYGLPPKALMEPARDLRESMADLEALLGNAVLLENTAAAPEWKCPENFAAAMCLPIGSPTMPHGTLWLWSDHVRDFSSEDVEAAKAATEKILTDIERSILADEVLKTRSISRGVESASLIQATRLPDTQPLHSDYEIAGWTFQGESLGGNFHNWNLNRFGEITAAVGDAVLPGTSGAIVATTLQTIVETCWNAKHDPKQVMRKANDMLFATDDGDWRTSLAYLKLNPETGSGNYGLAGSIQAFVVGINGFRVLPGTSTLLGQQPDTLYSSHSLQLEGGDLLVFATEGLLSGILHGGLTQSALLDTLQAMHEEPVDQIVDHLARQLPLKPAEGQAEMDRSLLILRRRF